MESKPIRLIDLREVERRTGLKRDSIYRLAKLKRMPGPVKVGEWASRWVESEIEDFLASKIAQRDNNAVRSESTQTA